MTKIAFDVDGTLLKRKDIIENGVVYVKDDIPNKPLINIIHYLYNNTDSIIFFWSGGGIEYTSARVRKLSLAGFGRVIPKTLESSQDYQIDISFDDQEVNLAKVNIRINPGE